MKRSSPSALSDSPVYAERYSFPRAANDVLSAPRQFGIITAVFTLCLLLMIVLSCSASTLKSEKCLQLMNIPSGDAHVLDTRFLMKIFDGPDGYQKAISDMEALLAENGMPGCCNAPTVALLSSPSSAAGTAQSGPNISARPTAATAR